MGEAQEDVRGGSPVPAPDRGAGEVEELWRWVAELEHGAQVGFRSFDLLHEVRNDLTIVFGAVQLAQMERDPESWRRALETTFGQARRIRERLERFERAARPGSAGESHELAELLDRAVDALLYPLSKTRARVERDVPGPVPVGGHGALLVPTIATGLLAILRRLPEDPRPVVRVEGRREGGVVVLRAGSADALAEGSPPLDRLRREEPWRLRRTGHEHAVAARVAARFGGHYRWDEAGARFELALPVGEEAGPEPEDPFRSS